MSFSQDVRFAGRMVWKDPGFALVVIAVLALGIGVNTTVFTLVNAVLFRGLPFEESDRVMYLSTNDHSKNRRDIGVSYADFEDWRSQTKTFKGLAGFSGTSFLITDASAAPERYSGPRVTSNFFSLIGQKPMLGRDFLPEEERAGASPVCIIGHTIWENRYGRDPNIIGRSIRVNDTVTTVVGVMPRNMKFPVNADMWVPLIPTGDFQKRNARNTQVFGRLAPGVTMAQARGEMERIAGGLEKQYPDTNRGITSMVIPYNDEFNGGSIRTLFFALLGAVGFVLLIACANVANLLLSRSLARTRDVAIRTALGASRWRVIRQLLVESVFLGVAGGVVGLLIAIWGVRMFDLAVANVGKPYWIVFRMDFTVFAYLAAVCVGTGLLFGLAPAIQLSKVDLNTTLKEGGRGTSGARSRYLSAFLVVAEVSLSLVLLVGAGLMIRSFLNMYNMTAGIRAERFLTMRLSLPSKKYSKDEERLRFYDRLQERLRAIPGVDAAVITSHTPLNGANSWKVEREDAAKVEEAKLPEVAVVVISPAYFPTLGARPVRGRTFTESPADMTSVVVNQRFAAKYWPGEDALGKRIKLYWGGERPWLTVIGVSPDIRQTRVEQAEADPVVYVPYRLRPVEGYSILLRAAVPPATLTSAARKEIQGLDGDMAVFAVRTLEEDFSQRRWAFRVFGTLFALFALIALVLTSVGLYAVMAYSVRQRTPEIGLRLAMGAPASRILMLVLKSGLRQLGIGLVIGLAAAFGVARVLKGLLVHVRPTDPTTFAAITALLVAVGVCACWIPARWALKVDPVVALRHE